MFKSKRIQQIQAYVSEHKTVSIDELVSVFDVSKNTIRRDVQWLVRQGEIKKVYGGVAANDSILVSFSDRQARNQTEKERIAEVAAGFVNDGDVIFIDSGTTTCEMVEYLKHKELTIITNNLNFIANSLPYENLNILTIGGILQRKTNSFVSLREGNFLHTYNVHKAFMASTGITLFHGVTNASPEESDIKKLAVARSAEVFLLVDHDKFNKSGLVTYCSLADLDYLITDSEPASEYVDFTKANDIQLVVAG